MTGPEIIILNAARFVGTHLLKWGYKKATENKNNEYTQSLYEIITEATTEYGKAFPIEETDKIPFYKSETLLQQFLKLRFNQVLDQEKVAQVIKEDGRIITPTREELNTFFDFFNRALETKPRIKELDIEANYKEEIYNISDFLKSLRTELSETLAVIKKEISLSRVSPQLMEEWNKQLDESADNLKAFKARTALERLENLESRIKAQNVLNDTLFAKLYSLQSDALALLEEKKESQRQGKLNIRIYKLNPNNLTYKANAALVYLSFGETETAIRLVDEILAEDEFHPVAWVVKCFTYEADFRTILPSVPKSIKKNDVFKINLYRWTVTKRYVATFDDLQECGLDLALNLSKPVVLTYKNLHFIQMAGVFLLDIYFSRHPHIEPRLIYPEAKGDREFEMAAELLKICATRVKGTEIEGEYLYYQFQHHCCQYALTRDENHLKELERIYMAMGTDVEPEVAVRMMQAYNSFANKQSEKALEIGDQYLRNHPPSELVLMMLAGTAGVLEDKSKQAKYFLQYMQFQKQIDAVSFSNIVRFIRNNGADLPESDKKAICDYIESANFEFPLYQIILQLLCLLPPSLTKGTHEQINQLITEARSLHTIGKEEISLIIALAYIATNQMSTARDFIRSYETFTAPTESYVRYCQLLFEMEDSDKLELLTLLQKYRASFPVNYSLLQMEVVLAQKQGKNKEMIRLSRLGHETFPASEFFTRALFISLDADLQTEEIGKIKGLANTNFKDERTAVVIAQILIKVKLFAEAIDLLYKYASNPVNTMARQSYFMLSHQFPPGTMSDFPEVQPGRFVKYEDSAGNSRIIEITEENKGKHPNNLFVGKAVGETVSFKRPFDHTLELFKISRVMDKYLALFEQVMLDAEDPLSDMGLKRIDIKGNSREDFNSAFIEAFGAVGSLEKEHSEKELEKYYRGAITFGEVTNAVFRRHFFDAYFALTDTDGKPFRALSPALAQAKFTEHSVFVLDPTSLSLFCFLEKEQGVLFSNHFVVSSFLRQHLVNELEKTRNEEYRLSVQITIEEVTPHVYDDQFKERRIAVFEGLLKWLDDHCTVADIPERLNVIAGLEEDQHDSYFNVYVDSRLLIDRTHHILLTNDLLYIRNFKASLSIALSPTTYLQHYHRPKQKEYTAYMLRQHYVGIPITAAIIKEEFFKMLAGQDNRFSTCLENLKFGWNPDPSNVSEAILFIKDLYVSGVVNDITKSQLTRAVLQSLLSGMPERVVNLLGMGLERQFNLLGAFQTEVLNILRELLKAK